MMFLVAVALAIGGSSWGAMRYVKSDFVGTAAANEIKAPPATTDAPPPPADPPPSASADPSPQPSTAPAQTSASAKITAKPKKDRGRRQAGQARPGERPPPNPYDDLANIDRAPTKP
jgi:hypothetical protein